MKYRIIFSKKAPASSAAREKRIELHRSHALIDNAKTPPIESSELFGFGGFYDPTAEQSRAVVPYNGRKKRKRLLLPLIKTLAKAVRGILSAAAKAFLRIVGWLREKLIGRKRYASALPALCGALCAALAIALVSSCTVIYKLLIEDYFGDYETVSVPDFVGAVYPNTEIFSETEYCNISVSYKYSSDTPEGTVISQTPEAGVQRRIYSRKSLCNVSLVVSLGEKIFTMNDYSGHTLREATLELKKESVRFSVSEHYSDTVPRGQIISTSPDVGEIFSAEDTVKITVSLGPEIKYFAVPELYGMTEARAISVLEASGLGVGNISYSPSSEPRGTVISQSHAPYSSVKEGEKISLTVSAGETYFEKKVPDLYGLNIEEAREKLAEYGLVLGKIYAVANGAPSGTVIAQSPIAGTPISAGLVSVDVYVSS